MGYSGSPDEQKVRDIIKKEGHFKWQGDDYKVDFCEKPSVKSGEPKTDTFVRATNEKTNKKIDIKISTKKKNFGYVQNHPRQETLKEFYAGNHEKIIKKHVGSLKENLQKTPIIYFDSYGNVEKGSITLGWRYEILEESAKNNNKTRSLGVKIEKDVAKLAWYGEGNSSDYLDAQVNGKVIVKSGMPDWILIADAEDIITSENIFSNLKDIKEYAEKHSNLDATLQAHNYRMHRKKTCECGFEYRIAKKCPKCKSRKWKVSKCDKCGQDISVKEKKCNNCLIENSDYKSSNPHEGDSRELAAWIDWTTLKGRLHGSIVFDKPFTKAGDVRKQLQKCLEELKTPDDSYFDINMLRERVTEDTCTYSK